MIIIRTGTVREVEKYTTPDGFDALRVRAQISQDNVQDYKEIPWAFPLLPKTFQSVPKEGEGVFVFLEDAKSAASQRYYLGPLISQPQYHTYCKSEYGTSLFKGNKYNPLPKYSKNPDTKGSFPEVEDVAVVGRGAEDVILKYDQAEGKSEVDIRAGIRQELVGSGVIGNVIFQGIDPAYIQLKYKKGLAKEKGQIANSLINIVANRINLMSNMDVAVEHNLDDNKELVKESEIDNVMRNLHQVPKGDVLLEYLELVRKIMIGHVHGWAGLPENGDIGGQMQKFKDFQLNDILSDYVRIS